jgi:tRNA threonylcarbamoyladenosine biosynthesis protein TsaE
MNDGTLMKIIIKDKSHLHQAAEKFLKLAGSGRIFAFYGQMGAGKTTIIRAICIALGATDTVTSPTFTLVNEYKTISGNSIYHIDFYRIKKPEEVFDFGIEEYFDSGSFCFMEWPELIEKFLPPATVRVRITVGRNEERILKIE